MTTTLTEFLLARIAEDADTVEHVLRVFGGSQHTPSSVNVEGREIYSLRRMLAECEAKQRIVDDYRAHVRHYESREAEGLPADAVRRDARVIRRAVVALAAVYADHPDYSDEWEPAE